jgi:hypothetical protein
MDEVKLRLVHEGVERNVINQQCGTDDDCDATFDDEAAQPNGCSGGTPAFTGIQQPKQSLDVFDGLAVEGTWSMIASDHENNDSGTLHEWCVTITYQ